MDEEIEKVRKPHDDMPFAHDTAKLVIAGAAGMLVTAIVKAVYDAAYDSIKNRPND